MAFPQYRLECVMPDGTPVGPLEGAKLTSATWELNGPGSLVYSMQQTSDNIHLPQEHINEVQLWVGQTLEHWCYLEKGTEKPRSVDFQNPGLLDYFKHRFITNTSLFYDTVEQMQIAAAIVQEMQAHADQSFHIGVYSYVASGVTRSRDYKITEHACAYDLLTEFPTLTNASGVATGFDIDIDIKSQPGNRLFRPYYPTKGSIRNDILLEWGKNITDYTVTRDGQRQATRVYATGGSNGDIKYENYFRDDTASAYYKEWQDVVAFGSEPDVYVLLELAQDQVAKRKNPVVNIDVTTVEVPDTLFGVVETGDWVRVAIHNGRTQIDDWYRVKTITWLPGAGNLKLGFQER